MILEQRASLHGTSALSAQHSRSSRKLSLASPNLRSNPQEYWAEGTQAWFDASVRSGGPPIVFQFCFGLRFIWVGKGPAIRSVALLMQ